MVELVGSNNNSSSTSRSIGYTNFSVEISSVAKMSTVLQVVS